MHTLEYSPQMQRAVERDCMLRPLAILNAIRMAQPVGSPLMICQNGPIGGSTCCLCPRMMSQPRRRKKKFCCLGGGELAIS
eukprot:5810938-Ditylum_brightwellii.AAC.1